GSADPRGAAARADAGRAARLRPAGLRPAGADRAARRPPHRLDPPAGGAAGSAAARGAADRPARAPDRGRLGRGRRRRGGPADAGVRTARPGRQTVRAGDGEIRARRRLPHRGAGMSAPMPLRRRFTLLALLLGFLLSGLASSVLMIVAEDYEYILSNEILRGQAEDYGLRLANHLPAQLPRTQRLSGYRIDDPALPRAYAVMPPGVHEDADNDDSHIGVFDTAAGRLVFVIDLGDIEAMERDLHLLIAAMLVCGTALSGWLGWWLAGIALKPVRTLAEGVE